MTARAQLDANGLCIGGYTISSNVPLGANEVDVTDDPSSYIGRTYANGAWSARVTQPTFLDHLDFITLCQTAGGMTDAMLVDAHNDATLASLWIKFDHAPDSIHKDHPLVSPGLSALAAAGYLPNGAQAVLDAWPVS